jgi:hypothetical protein
VLADLVAGLGRSWEAGRYGSIGALIVLGPK